MNLRRIALASTIALTTMLTPMIPANTYAAIPCSPNPLIETSANQIMPLIYRELPINFVDFMRGSQPVERPSTTPGAVEATPADGGSEGSSAQMAAEGLLRCMGYGDSAAVLTSSTPHVRAFRVGIGNPDGAVTYLDAGTGVFTVSVENGLELEDGRWVVDYAAIIDDTTYIAGEMVLVQDNGFFYLDDAYLTTEATLDGDIIEIPLNEISTREVKIYEVSQGDRVVWNNESESYIDIQVKDVNGDVIFTGGVMSDNMVGGENHNVLPIVGLAPGEYTIVTTFQGSGIVYTATLIVAE